MVNWNHIMDKQPEHNELIVMLDSPYEGNFHTLGIIKYQQNCSFQEVLDVCEKYASKKPDFWWISAKDFPFPDKPSTNKEENDPIR